jgi:hypothetical protein
MVPDRRRGVETQRVALAGHSHSRFPDRLLRHGNCDELPFPSEAALYAEYRLSVPSRITETTAKSRGCSSGRRCDADFGNPLNLLVSVPCLSYGDAADQERQLCEFILRGIGLNEAASAARSIVDRSNNNAVKVTYGFQRKRPNLRFAIRLQGRGGGS